MPQASPISWIVLILVLIMTMLVLSTKPNTFKTPINKMTLSNYKKWLW